MPPFQLDLPRLAAAAGGDGHEHASATALAVGGAGTDVNSIGGAWVTWPLVAFNALQAAVKGCFAELDSALLGLPKGLGPAMSAMVRLLSLLIAASIVSAIISKTTRHLLRLPSKASKLAVADKLSYTPGRHNWVAAHSRWESHYCSICGEAIAWVSDSGVRCRICGSHAHLSCSKRANKEGLACKALCSADVELAHRRLLHPLKPLEESNGDDDARSAGTEEANKRPPIMRHQWVPGSINESKSCAGCGGSCAGSGPAGQRGYSCAWCNLQVHEGCVRRMAETQCTLGRHRRLILPPIAVLKDQPRRRGKGSIIRDAVSKVRSVLPGQHEQSSSSRCLDSDDPDASAGSQSFVEAVREAVAAAAAAKDIDLDVASARDAGRRIAEKMREAGIDVAAVAGAKESGRRLVERVREALPMMEDDVWEEALGGAVETLKAEGEGAFVPGEAGTNELFASAPPSSPSRDLPRDVDDCAGTGVKSAPDKSVGVPEQGQFLVTDDGSEHATELPSPGDDSRADDIIGAADARGTVSPVTAEKEDISSAQKAVVPDFVGLADTTEAPAAESPAAQDQEETISSEYATVTSGKLQALSASESVVSPAHHVEPPSQPSGTTEVAAATEAVTAEGAAHLTGGEDVQPGKGPSEEAATDAREKQVDDDDEGVDADEHTEPEWVVKMQELKPRFHTSGEGASATKSVSYSRKIRSVTLTICEENIPADTSPLLVFVNSKSGGKQGNVLLNRFRALLNPLQVSDLSAEDPLDVLQRFRNVPKLRLLACGGDGTVAWLLQTVDAISWKANRPPLAILPLGTGNDLARVLGWGRGYTGEGLDGLLEAIESAQVTMLDRWSVSVIADSKGGFRKGSKAKDRQLIMNNYIGIGVDGQVALDFHKMREARPLLFFNRAVNKVLYAQLGARSALVRACHDLPRRLEIRCDGELVELPETTASVIALNINSFGGGSKLWAAEERSRRASSGRSAQKLPGSPQRQTTTAWGFDTSGLIDPDAPNLPAKKENPKKSPDVQRAVSGRWSLRTWGRNVAPDTDDGKGSATSREQDLGTVGRLRAGVASDLQASPSKERGSMDSLSSGESTDDAGLALSSEASSEADSTDYGRDGSQGGRSSFSDGVLEVVAVEGVLHLGQIQLGLSRALGVAQCRELQVRTSSMLPMQVDGEPWKQPPSEITVKLHNQAAMLRPSTAMERAVASVLDDVTQAVHGAEQDLIINERQARTLLSRIRRSARLPGDMRSYPPTS